MFEKVLVRISEVNNGILLLELRELLLGKVFIILI